MNKRITTKKFKEIYKNGRKIFTDIFLIKYIENDLNYNRFSVVVGKKVYKNAVNRNKLKRQFRAIFTNIKTKKNIDIVCITFPKVKTSNYKEFEKSIFKKISSI